MKNILLLTATIKPLSNIVSTKLIDPEVRFNQYQEALEFYLKFLGSTIDYIVFAENSGSDISKLENLVKAKSKVDLVEFINYYGLDFKPNCGKGYGEFLLIDNVITKSKLINQLSKADIIWKISGRYKIINICKIIQMQPKNYDLYCNYKSYPQNYMDMYLFAWKHGIYDICLKNVYRRFCESKTKKAPEFIFREILNSSGLNIVKRFNIVPIVNTINGCNNKANLSLMGYCKYLVRVILNQIFPDIWI